MDFSDLACAAKCFRNVALEPSCVKRRANETQWIWQNCCQSSWIGWGSSIICRFALVLERGDFPGSSLLELLCDVDWPCGPNSISRFLAQSCVCRTWTTFLKHDIMRRIWMACWGPILGVRWGEFTWGKHWTPSLRWRWCPASTYKPVK